MPMGESTDDWSFGDIEAGFKNCGPRSRRNLRQPVDQPSAARDAHGDGLLAERQAVPPRLDAEHRADGGLAGAVDRRSHATDIVFISEYTGGGFGSKIPGAISMAIPALMSKKANAPVHDAHLARRGALHRPRPSGSPLARQGWLPEETAASPRSTSIVWPTTVPTSAGRFPVGRQHHLALLSADGDAVARRDGADQHAAAHLAARARRHAGQRPHRAGSRQGGATSWASIRSQIRLINAPAGKAPFGPPAARGKQAYVTSAFVKEALDKGAELFNWEERKARSGKRQGTKVRGSGVAVSAYRRRIDRLRRPLHHQAGRPRAVPVGHRQSRHPLGHRRASRRR